MASSDELTLAQRHPLLTMRTHATITTFTPIFAERFARDRLRSRAKEGST